MAEALRIFDVLYNTLPHKYLTKVDRASMHHSLEVRSPFLDYRFFEYAQTIPTNWKLSVRRGKLMLGELVKEIVPDSIISRKKQGFEPPVYDWLRDPKHEAVLTHGLKNLTTLAPEVAAWYQKYDHLSHVDSKHLFRLFAFQLWWKVWMKNNVHSN